MNNRTHPTAIIDPQASISPTAKIGPYCVVEGNVVIHDDVCLDGHVWAQGPLTLHRGVRVYPFSSVGADPEDLKYQQEETTASIGAGTVIRERAVVCRGTKAGGGATVVGENCFIMGQSYIGHDCIIGNRCVISMGAMIAGHVNIADTARIGASAVVHQFVRIGNHAMIGAGARITRDVYPFALVHPSDSLIRGVNLIGLRRYGLSGNKIRAIQRAFVLLGSRERLLQERIETIQHQLATDDISHEELAILLNFAKTTGRRGFTSVDMS